MKLFTTLLALILTTTINQSALAQKYVEQQDIAVSNLLSGLNPGAENGKAKWVASSPASFSTVTSGANKYQGNASFSFDASAASQTITGTAKVAGGFAGKSGVGSCYIKTAATDYKLQVLKNGSLDSEIVIGSLSEFTKVSVPFTFGLSTDTYAPRLISQSNAAILYYDTCSIDLAENSSASSSQAYLFGTATDNASCQYSNNTPSSWQDMPEVTPTCGVYSYTGGLSASGLSGPQPSFQIADMTAGDYKIDVTGAFVCANNASNQNCSFSLYDGTNRYNAQNIISSVGAAGFMGVNTLSFLVSKGASSSNQVFRIQSYVNTQATINVDGTSGTGTSPLIFSVYKFPSSSEQAQRVNEQSSYGIVKSTNSIGAVSTSSGTYVNMNVSGFSTGNEYTGSAAACTTADDICLKVGKLKQGLYDVYLNATLYATSTASCAYRLYDGTNAIGEFTIIAPNSASIQTSAPGLRGKLSVNSDVYNKEITLQAYMVGGAGGCTVYGGAGASIEIGILPSTIAVADFMLKNSVQSSSSGSEILNRAKILNNGASASIGSQSGSWLSSCIRNGAGQVDCTIAAGIFSSSPSCILNAISANNESIRSIAAPTTTLFSTQAWVTSSNAAADLDFDVICTGSKP